MSTREEKFEKEIQNTLEELGNLLIVKGKEYMRNNNPFHNFEVGAKITGKHRTEILEGFLLKHLISISDMKTDLKKGKLPNFYVVHEKYNDILLYFLIEKAMLLEDAEEY